VSQQPRFFIPLPWAFFDAWLVDRRVKRTHVLSAVYVAARCFEVKNTGHGIAPIELSTIARLCNASTETIRRTLHDLRSWGWIDFRAGHGGDPAWRIWVTGLSLEGPSPRPRNDLSTETPPAAWRGLSTAAQVGADANQHGDRTQPSPTSPQSVSGEPPKRNETRPQEKNNRKPLSEEELDNVLGEGTKRENDRFLAALREVNARPPVRVEVDKDGSLDWHGEPQEGEQGFLDDCEALVDAGLATWVEGPA
jgi:hypothetical protein